MRIDRTRLPLVSEQADTVLGYPSTAINGDYSLHALLRAIVINKSKKEVTPEELNEAAGLGICRITSSELSEVPVAYPSSVVICEITDDAKVDELTIDGWETFDKADRPINMYLSQFNPTKIFRNKAQKRIIALVKPRASNMWTQAFSCSLCALLSWYFPRATKEVKDLFRSISPDNKSIKPEKAQDILVGYVEEAANKINLRNLWLHKKLDRIADTIRDQEIKDTSERVEHLAREIEEYRNSLYSKMRDYDEATIKLRAYELLPSQGDTSMFDFFSEQENIKVVDVSGSDIYYEVIDVLDGYDEDEIFTTIENDRSWINSYDSDVVDAIKEIFVNHKGLIRVGAQYRLGGLKRISYMQHEFKLDGRTMPSPHPDMFGCSGGNDKYFAEYAESGEWMLSIMQSVSATKNLNFGDITVSRAMVKWLIDNDDVPCIYVNQDESEIERVTSGSKLISFRDFITEYVEK